MHLRFIAAAPDAPACVSAGATVGAGVGLTQAKGLAAQVRALRRAGHDDEAISRHLNLAPGQIFKLLMTVKKAENAAAERLENAGRMLPLGAKKALKLNSVDVSKERGARNATRAIDKGYAARIVAVLTKRKAGMTVPDLAETLGAGKEGVRTALRKLEAAGRVKKSGRFQGGRFGAAGKGAVIWEMVHE